MICGRQVNYTRQITDSINRDGNHLQKHKDVRTILRKEKKNMGMTVNAMAGMQAASETISDYSATAKAAETSEKKASAETEKDAVYEKNTPESAKAPYSINKMSKEDRAALVKQLKADQESRQTSFTNLVSQMLGKQAGTYGIANGDDSIWKIFANGNFTVDAAAKAQAQEDVSEDGYWGVKQTSQRLFDFASALAGTMRIRCARCSTRWRKALSRQPPHGAEICRISVTKHWMRQINCLKNITSQNRVNKCTKGLLFLTIQC